MKIKTYTLYIIGLLLTACSHIEEGERLIYVKPASVARSVLLEDFTGQRCVNCPKGTEVIEQLQEEYGDAIIAVGIHGGPLGFMGSNTLVGLATEVGNEYYDHWQLEYQPVGLVNRHGAVNYTDWTTTVRAQLAITAPLSMEALASIQDDKIEISTTITGIDGNTTGKLQLWVLEDGITAMQLMPDGTANSEYIHNHVLRIPVNGTWGEDFTIQEGETKTTRHTQTLDPLWNSQQLSIVAFVYNDQGVQQAVKTKVNNNDDNIQ
ncbi:MAG: Omp28 family outer membrane lipoprotein [Prevotella sp.]|nr:Omp28 family outer membrane lipoprotein [Prevotella sp.]